MRNTLFFLFYHVEPGLVATFIQRHVCIDDAFSDICVIQEANFNLWKAISSACICYVKQIKKQAEREREKKREGERERDINPIYRGLVYRI